MNKYKIDTLSKLSPQTVNKLIETAINIELNDRQTAMQLITLAHSARPDDPNIKKLSNRIINPSKSDLKLKKMLMSGELAIIPIGFRCQTKSWIRHHFAWTQPSLPFDYGFFSPISVSSVIKEKKVNLNFNDGNLNHTVCIKYENYHDSVYGRGIKFKKSTYEEINSYALSRDMAGLNQYLDAAYGYYTLDLKHNFVLAHYNWHVFAHHKKSKGIYDPKTNMENINKMLNRRIERMFKICNIAKFVFFVFFKGYPNYMLIDDKYIDLNDLEVVKIAVEEAFTTKSFVVKLKDFNNSEKFLEILRTY